jgi:5-methylcytosine-specific restriction endonuclease McrA
MSSRAAHNARPKRESLSKRLGRVARQIAARDGHVCVYCGRSERQSKAPLQLDHVLPRVCGGADVAGNLVLACRRCNAARQDRSLADWARYARIAHGVRFMVSRIERQVAKPLPAV